MTDQPKPDLVEAARAICRALGVDPDAATSSAHAAPPMWEHYLPHATAAGAVFAVRLRAMAEIARGVAMVSKDQLDAERLKAQADALHEAAALFDERAAGDNVVEFPRR